MLNNLSENDFQYLGRAGGLGFGSLTNISNLLARSTRVQVSALQYQ